MNADSAALKKKKTTTEKENDRTENVLYAAYLYTTYVGRLVDIYRY